MSLRGQEALERANFMKQRVAVPGGNRLAAVEHETLRAWAVHLRGALPCDLNWMEPGFPNNYTEVGSSTPS